MGTPARLQRSRLALITRGHFLNDCYGSFFAPILPLLIEKLSLSLTMARRRIPMACKRREPHTARQAMQTLLLGGLLLVSALLPVGQAQVSLDGSLGPGGL
jgi:hypothetical protein